MKESPLNIIIVSLIIIALNITSCRDISKSYCEDILEFSYTDNDSLIENYINTAIQCSEKYHKQPIFFQKISQIYYHKAISEDPSDNNTLQSAKDLYLALENINTYFQKIDEIKPYDYQFRGEIYERIGDIYKNNNSLKPASELYDKALSEYEKARNNEKTLNILIKVGKLYQYNHMPNIAMIYFEMAEEKENIPDNIYRKIIDNKIVTLYELSENAKADSIFTNHFNIKIQDYDFHSAIGTKYFYERNYKKSLPHLEHCFENGSLQEKFAISEKLAEVYFNLNDHDSELFYIQYQAKSNSIEIKKTPIKLDLEKLFDTNTNIINNKDDITETNSNKSLIIIIIISSIIIASIFIIFRKNKKKDLEKIRSAQKDIDNKHEIIQSKNKIIDDISQKLIDLKPNEDFNDAYLRFMESPICVKIKSSFEGISILTKNVQNYKKLLLSNKDYAQIMKTFTNCFPNAITSIKSDFEGITIGDIKFIILSFLNLNDIEIAVLLGLTYGATNKRSNKIKNIFKTKDNLNDFLTKYIKSKF